MIAHYAYVYTSVLGTIRVPESKSVSLHRVSRHVGMDISNLRSKLIKLDEMTRIRDLISRHIGKHKVNND
jgi:hypothetical protein